VLSLQTGFSPSTITANVEPNRSYNTPQKQRNLIKGLLEGIKSIPGVETVGMIDHLPLTDSENLSSIFIEGYPNDTNQLIEDRCVTPDYLSAMQVPMLAGRGFSQDDGPGSAPIAIVNEVFAKKYFGGHSPIGRHIRQGTQGQWSTVVGLIGDIRNEGLEAQAQPQVYRPFLQNEDSEGVHNLAVRSALPRDALVSAMRRVVHAIDPTLPIENVHAMSDLVSQATARRRFQTTLLTVFSGIAMLLAVVGVYGLLAYSVRQRTGEIGIRIALGSSKLGVVRLILREGITLLGVGLVIGVAAALVGARLLTGFLYDVSALDPTTFALVPILLLVATLAASLIPSLRAAAVDPINALRHE
jgi:predicted permease